MESFVIGIFVVIALVFLAALAFLAWLVFMIVRSLYRGVVGAVKLPAKAVSHVPRLAPAPKSPPQLQYFPVRAPEIQWARCPRDRCRTPNPPDAQFCRRCGMNLVAAKVSASPTNGRMLARA